MTEWMISGKLVGLWIYIMEKQREGIIYRNVSFQRTACSQVGHGCHSVLPWPVQQDPLVAYDMHTLYF